MLTSVTELSDLCFSAATCSKECMLQAYDTLMNSKARKAYDAQLEVALKDDEDGFLGALLRSCCAAPQPLPSAMASVCSYEQSS